MTSASKRTQVIKWTEEAQYTLEKARELCSNAQTSLHNMGVLLTERIPDLLDYAGLMTDTAKEQFSLVSNMVEEVKRQLYRDRAKMLENIEREVVPALEELNAIVSRLRKTAVPQYLIDKSEIQKQGDKLQYSTLEDFISTESLRMLYVNVDTYRTNTEKVYQMLHEEFQSHMNDQFQKCSKRQTRMLKNYDELIPLQLDFKWTTTTQASPEHEALTNTIMKENSSLEHELVSILEMLTNHYDQCSSALQFVKREGTKKFNFSVLENDASELPDVLKELKAVCDIIKNNETRVLKFINTRLPFLESSISYASEQLSYFREFKTRQFPKFLVLLRESNNLLKIPPPNPESSEEGSIELYLDTIRQLVYHYTCFLDVFKTKYVEELYYEQYVYPRRVIDILKKFLDEDLGVMQNKERDRRKQWLAANGDFIPKELKLPGEANLPLIVQIVTEGLESVQDEIEGTENQMKEEEEELIALARKMKLSTEDR